jgi:hypothetical protein
MHDFFVHILSQRVSDEERKENKKQTRNNQYCGNNLENRYHTCIGLNLCLLSIAIIIMVNCYWLLNL